MGVAHVACNGVCVCVYYMILNTEFHKFQDDGSVDYVLHYDPEFCTRLIEPNKKDKDIFYWSDLFD